MALKTTDKILSTAVRADVSAAIAFLNGPDAKDQEFLTVALPKWCAVAGIDLAVALAQVFLETGNLESPRWNVDLNCAGIGIPADSTLQQFKIQNIDEAARIYCQVMWSAVNRALHARIPLPDASKPWFDQVWLPKVTASVYPAVRTIADLNIRYTGTNGQPQASYAWDADYPASLVSRGNAAGVAGRITGGAFPTKPNVDQPTIYRLVDDYARFDITYGQMLAVRDNRFEGRNGAQIRAILCHVQGGVTTGSLSHWSIVEASSTVMIQRDGSILQVIDEADGPWTNGDVNQPSADVAWLIALGGNVNNRCLTIEAEGDESNSLTAAEEDAIVWQVETWALRYPQLMQELLRITYGHYNLNSVSRAFCGRYVARIDERVGAWLAEGGAVMEPKPEPRPEPLIPAGMSVELLKRLGGRVTVPWSSKVFEFDLDRSEWQTWLIRSKATIPAGGTWEDGKWPELTDIIRRGKTHNIHVYQWADGSVYEKIIRRD